MGNKELRREPAERSTVVERVPQHLAFDPAGRPVIAFTDYGTRQIFEAEPP